MLSRMMSRRFGLGRRGGRIPVRTTVDRPDAMPAPVDGAAPRWSQVRVLLGYQHSSGLIAALMISSVLTGLAESAMLAIFTQVATTLVGGTSRAHIDAGPFHGSPTIATLIAIAFGLALLRLVLQIVASWVPPRIAADTQARLRTELFQVFTGASWGVQSRDREGHLQELLTDQVAMGHQRRSLSRHGSRVGFHLRGAHHLGPRAQPGRGVGGASRGRRSVLIDASSEFRGPAGTEKISRRHK